MGPGARDEWEEIGIGQICLIGLWGFQGIIHSFTYPVHLLGAFPSGSDGKASAYNAGDLGSIPRLGRSSGEGNGNPLQYSCLEKSHGQRTLVGYSPWDPKELDTTKWLHFLSFTFHRLGVILSTEDTVAENQTNPLKIIYATIEPTYSMTSYHCRMLYMKVVKRINLDSSHYKVTFFFLFIFSISFYCIYMRWWVFTKFILVIISQHL